MKLKLAGKDSFLLALSHFILANGVPYVRLLFYSL
jgi:hypothetical protein